MFSINNARSRSIPPTFGSHQIYQADAGWHHRNAHSGKDGAVVTVAAMSKMSTQGEGRQISGKEGKGGKAREGDEETRTGTDDGSAS